MNLLDKIWSGLLIIATLTIFSCEDPSDIGLALDPDGLRVSVLYEEFPLEVTNVLVDSIRTSGGARMLIGRSSDFIFGATSSSLISQLNFANGLEELKADTDTNTYVYVIDSTVLNLDIEKVHTEDINLNQSYKVHQLTDTIFGGAYYLANFKTPYYSDTTEGEFNFTLDHNLAFDLRNDSSYVLSFRMKDSMGKEFFEVRQDESSPSNILRYDYKGIAIVGDANNNVLLGIKPAATTNITVHYHIRDFYTREGVANDSVYTDSLGLQLVFHTNNAFYSSITTDRSGSLMSAADVNVDFGEFVTSDNNAYAQPVSGIFPKLDLTPLTAFFEEHKTIQINRMEFWSKTSSNSTFVSNVNDFRYFFLDGKNKIDNSGLATNSSNLFLTGIKTDNGYLASLPEMMITRLDSLDANSFTYAGVPTFFAQLLETGTFDGEREVDHLILMPNDLTSPDYSIFDRDTGFKIKLYYTLPNE